MKIDLKMFANSLTDENIIDIMNHLGANNYEETNSAIIFPTICHNYDADEASMKLYYYRGNKKFHCYTECDANFNIYEMVRKRWALTKDYQLSEIESSFSFRDILEFLFSVTGLREFDFHAEKDTYKSVRSKYKEKLPVRLNEYDEGRLEIFDKWYTPEWLQENISVASMEKFNIRYSISQNKIIIPHYNINGKLIGIRGRALNQEEIDAGCKYMPVKIEGKFYAHPLSLNLYGLDRNYKDIAASTTLFLFEGEKSVLLYDSHFSQCAAAAVCGSNLNKNQIDILLKNFDLKEIVVCFDKEYVKYGTDESKKYFNKLYSLCEKYSMYYNFSFIFDMDGLLNEKDSPIDKGKDTFIKLYKKRIKVN